MEHNAQDAGNCLFDAFAQLLEAPQSSRDLRRMCVEYWRRPEMCQKLRETAAREGLTPVRCCSRMSRTTWGGRP